MRKNWILSRGFNSQHLNSLESQPILLRIHIDMSLTTEKDHTLKWGRESWPLQVTVGGKMYKYKVSLATNRSLSRSMKSFGTLLQPAMRSSTDILRTSKTICHLSLPGGDGTCTGR
jgi:hypothetical protein